MDLSSSFIETCMYNEKKKKEKENSTPLKKASHKYKEGA